MRTSYEPVLWPPTLDGKSHIIKIEVIRGEAFFQSHALREAAQRANEKMLSDQDACGGATQLLKSEEDLTLNE